MDKQLVGIQKSSEDAERRKEEAEAQLTDMVADHDKVLVSMLLHLFIFNTDPFFLLIMSCFFFFSDINQRNRRI